VRLAPAEIRPGESWWPDLGPDRGMWARSAGGI